MPHRPSDTPNAHGTLVRAEAKEAFRGRRIISCDERNSGLAKLYLVHPDADSEHAGSTTRSPIFARFTSVIPATLPPMQG